MPLFEFVCNKCQHEQELLLRGDQQPRCEACGVSDLTKLLSVPAAHAATGQTRPSGELPPGGCGSGCSCFPG